MFFHRYLVLFFLILRQPQIHTLFPYTTLFRSRMEPTSPARCFGAAVTRTLNTSVTKAPWPIPNTISPRIVGRDSQLLSTTAASQSSATVVSANENRAIVRGAKRP